MKVVIIGTGNTATALGRLIKQSGYSVLQVCGRTTEATRTLAESLDAAYATSMKAIDPNGDLYLMAVSDDAIATIAGQFSFHTKLLVHTAGSVSIDILKEASRNYGVLYPLQSLRKEAGSLPVIPFLVDGNTGDDLTLLYDFAQTLSPLVQKAGDAVRKKYHLAAVLVNNFSNHLYSLAKDFCAGTQTDFNLLLPLIQQLPPRLNDYSPQELQTGPAIRNDQVTIDTHLTLLKDYPEIKNLYALFTKGIQEYYRRK